MSKDRVEFKAYRGNDLVAHTWATRGTHAETMERDMYKSLISQGHYTRVEVSTEKIVWELLV